MSKEKFLIVTVDGREVLRWTRPNAVTSEVTTSVADLPSGESGLFISVDVAPVSEPEAPEVEEAPKKKAKKGK